jgi:hypothetical protein
MPILQPTPSIFVFLEQCAKSFSGSKLLTELQPETVPFGFEIRGNPGVYITFVMS